MRHPLSIRRFRSDARGATAVEFAIVSGAFFMLMFGVIEYGLIMFSKVVIESAMQQASRDVAIGRTRAGCSDRVCSIKQIIAEKTQNLIDPQSVILDATVISTPTAAAPSVPDICLDAINDPYALTCTVFEDNNGVSGYQPATGATNASIGNPGDIVEVRVTYLWRVLFPIFRSKFGQNGVLTITSSTVVKNEPF